MLPSDFARLKSIFQLIWWYVLYVQNNYGQDEISVQLAHVLLKRLALLGYEFPRRFRDNNAKNRIESIF